MPPDETEPGSEETLAQQTSADPRDFETSAPTPKEDLSAEPAAGSAFPPAPQPRRLVYLPAFRYVFESPDWFATIVFATVFSFLPVLGTIAIWGYSYEILESLFRRPNAPYPKFEFGRWGHYCMRGVWPFVLVQMVGAIIAFVLQLVYQVTIQGGLMLWLSNPQLAALVTAIVAPIFIVGLLLLAISVAVGTSPFLLRAGLTQDIRQVFSIDWIKGYWKRVWAEQIMAFLFQLAAMALLRSLGCLLFGVGFFAAFTVLWIAGSHIQWQIYEIYLERGGEPIPLNPLPAEAPPVQLDMPRV